MQPPGRMASIPSTREERVTVTPQLVQRGGRRGVKLYWLSRQKQIPDFPLQTEDANWGTKQSTEEGGRFCKLVMAKMVTFTA